MASFQYHKFQNLQSSAPGHVEGTYNPGALGIDQASLHVVLWHNAIYSKGSLEILSAQTLGSLNFVISNWGPLKFYILSSGPLKKMCVFFCKMTQPPPFHK